MSDKRPGTAHGRWAEFRFGVIGGLFSAPPGLSARTLSDGGPVAVIDGIGHAGAGGQEAWRRSWAAMACTTVEGSRPTMAAISA